MKDKYAGLFCMTAVAIVCVGFNVPYAKEVVLMALTALAAFVRD